MKICFFGIYDSNYSRNRVLIKGFKENEYEIIECKVDPRIHKGVSKFFALAKEYKKIKSNKFDFILVAFPGHSLVWLAKLLSGKKIIFDAFLSLYNSEIQDRRKYNKFSFKAFYYYSLDKISCVLADKVILDTNEHIKYFINKYNIKKTKFIKVFVGSDDSIFYPKEKTEETKKFTIHFHGHFQSLQGIRYILEATKILEGEKDIQFNIVGKKLKDTRNVKFIDNLSVEKLVEYINNSDLILGIFGNTQKTQMVIPNKVYEGIACAKPVLTSNTKAIKELFSENEIFMCKSGDSIDLASKILELKNNPELIEKVGKNGYSLFINKLKPKNIVYNLIKEI